MKVTAYNDELPLTLAGAGGIIVSNNTRTSLGSNTPLIESGLGSPGSGPQAAAWDHVHPALAGGSSSFGSNSTRVASVSAAGASSSNSRVDHVHDGIGTITASGSNTLNRGTVNLRAGTGIALALSNTDGGSGFDTVTITNVAASGGGGGGGASGVSWTQDVNENGSSFANWTAVGGTWASDGTTINQTNAAGLTYAVYATQLAIGFPFIMEFEVFIITASGRGGFGLLDSGAGNGGLVVYATQGSGIIVEQKGNSVIRTFTTTITASTWYKIRFVVGSPFITLYKDGAYLGSTNTAKTWSTTMDFPSFYTFNASVKYRNVKAWTLSGGAPA